MLETAKKQSLKDVCKEANIEGDAEKSMKPCVLFKDKRAYKNDMSHDWKLGNESGSEDITITQVVALQNGDEGVLSIAHALKSHGNENKDAFKDQDEVVKHHEALCDCSYSELDF